jgi:twinkle protein
MRAAPEAEEPEERTEGGFTVLRDFTGRGITAETSRRYGVKLVQMPAGDECVMFPYHEAPGVVCGHKFRQTDQKKFFVSGRPGANFFGRYVTAGTRRLVITEGEFDALAVAEALGPWPVVSIPAGAANASKAILENMDWIGTFDEVVVWFDNDKPGQKAVQDCAPLFRMGRLRLVRSIPQDCKDANDVLMKHGLTAVKNCVYGAEAYAPEGLVSGAKLFTRLQKQRTLGHPYPFVGLNEMLLGMRPGEVTMWFAGTNVGKSTVVQYVGANLVRSGVKVGVVALEENVERTLLRYLSTFESRPLHLSETLPVDELTAKYEQQLGENLVCFDNESSYDPEVVFARMRHMVLGDGCEVLILDHISALAERLQGEDERKGIDHMIYGLAALANELQVHIHVISHVSATARDAEGGGSLRLADGRGSKALAQVPDTVIALERDLQDPVLRSVTRFRVLKNRYLGITGIAGHWRYNAEHCTFEQVDPETLENPNTDIS